MKNSIKIIAAIIFTIYVIICAYLYIHQREMIFPAQQAKVVPANWQPTAGTSQEQALIHGQCGQLHVAKWNIDHAIGTIMIFHGNGESLANVESRLDQFFKLGYNVMAWDYAGYGKSTPCWFSESDLLHDADSAYQWLAHKVPAQSIVIYGHSIGTGLALYVASQHHPHLVLLVSPYDEMLNVVKDNTFAFVPVPLLLRYPLKADEWINHINGKISAIHGTADQLILPAHAQRLIDQAQGHAHIEWIAGAGHNGLGRYPQFQSWLAKQLSIPYQTGASK